MLVIFSFASIRSSSSSNSGLRSTCDTFLFFILINLGYFGVLSKRVLKLLLFPFFSVSKECYSGLLTNILLAKFFRESSFFGVGWAIFFTESFFGIMQYANRSYYLKLLLTRTLLADGWTRLHLLSPVLMITGWSWQLAVTLTALICHDNHLFLVLI